MRRCFNKSSALVPYLISNYYGPASVLPVGRFSPPIGLVSIRSCGKILEFAGCGFLGYFLFKVAGYWAGFWAV